MKCIYILNKVDILSNPVNVMTASLTGFTVLVFPHSVPQRESERTEETKNHWRSNICTLSHPTSQMFDWNSVIA